MSPPSPTEREQFNTTFDSGLLLAFKRACLPNGYSEVLEVLMQLYVEDRTLFNRVRRALQEGT